MLKLKILNKPKTLKLKCTSKFPDVVLANLQEKTIESSTEQQIVQADKPYDGLSKVTVEPYTLEEKVITPSKETQEVLPSIANGLSKVVVNGDENLIADNIKQGTSIFGVIGTVVPSDNNAQMETVATSSSAGSTFIKKMIKKIPAIDTSKMTNMSEMFRDCTLLESVDLSKFNTSKVTNMMDMFYNCNSLKTIDASSFDTSNVNQMYEIFGNCSSLTSIDVSSFNTSKVLNMAYLFYGCKSLKTLDISNFDASKVGNGMQMFYQCTELENLKFMKNFGAYVSSFANNSAFTVDLSTSSKLTHESLMNVINNLYDLNLSYDVANGGTLYTQSLVLPKSVQSLLAESEIAIVTSKGWNVAFK